MQPHAPRSPDRILVVGSRRTGHSASAVLSRRRADGEFTSVSVLVWPHSHTFPAPRPPIAATPNCVRSELPGRPRRSARRHPTQAIWFGQQPFRDIAVESQGVELVGSQPLASMWLRVPYRG